MRCVKYIGAGAFLTTLVILLFVTLPLGITLAGHNGPSAPSITSTQSGAWSNPGIWSGGRPPRGGDEVLISKGTVVTYDVFSKSAIAELNIEGSLVFSRAADTNLDVGDILVGSSGYFEVGTAADPVPAGVTATVRFVNSSDGEHGLLVSGEAQIHGQPLAYVYTTLAVTVQT